MNTRVMRRRLVIHTPTIGFNFHTYLKREIEALHEEHDVIVSCVAELTDGWTCPCPVLSAARIHSSALAPPKWDRVTTNYTMLPQAAKDRFAQMLVDGTIERYVADHRTEGVFVQWLDDTLPLVDLAERLRLPYIVRCHGTDIAAGIMQDSTRRLYAAYGRVRAVLAGSQYARSLLPRCGIPESVGKVAPFALEPPSRFASPGSNPDRVNVLTVGRIELVKGSIFSLVGFKIAADQDPRLFLNVVGAGTLLPAYRQLVDALDLGQKVKLWGLLPNEGAELAELWQTSDIFLQSSVVVPTESSIETFCVGALEAMAAGLAMIVSDSQALPELVAGGACGTIVPAGNSAAIGMAVLELARAPERLAAFGAMARKRVTDHYTKANQCDAVLSALFA